MYKTTTGKTGLTHRLKQIETESSAAQFLAPQFLAPYCMLSYLSQHFPTSVWKLSVVAVASLAESGVEDSENEFKLMSTSKTGVKVQTGAHV